MKFIGAVVVAFIAGFIGALLTAWPVMLLVGAAHSTDDRIPALGFVTTLFLTVALSIATAHAGSSSS